MERNQNVLKSEEYKRNFFKKQAWFWRKIPAYLQRKQKKARG